MKTDWQQSSWSLNGRDNQWTTFFAYDLPIFSATEEKRKKEMIFSLCAQWRRSTTLLHVVAEVSGSPITRTVSRMALVTTAYYTHTAFRVRDHETLCSGVQYTKCSFRGLLCVRVHCIEEVTGSGRRIPPTWIDDAGTPQGLQSVCVCECISARSNSIKPCVFVVRILFLNYFHVGTDTPCSQERRRREKKTSLFPNETLKQKPWNGPDSKGLAKVWTCRFLSLMHGAFERVNRREYARQTARRFVFVWYSKQRL